MPIGDESRWSTVDAALWDVLQDTTTTAGTSLQAWRAEQSGGPGEDFEFADIPVAGKFRDAHFPALAVDDGEVVEPGTPRTGSEEVVYLKRILGLLHNRPDQVTVQKKLKRFAELVWEVITAHRSTCFNVFITGTNPIQRVRLQSLTFPKLLDDQSEEVWVFDLVLRFDMEVAHRAP